MSIFIKYHHRQGAILAAFKASKVVGISLREHAATLLLFVDGVDGALEIEYGDFVVPEGKGNFLTVIADNMALVAASDFSALRSITLRDLLEHDPASVPQDLVFSECFTITAEVRAELKKLGKYDIVGKVSHAMEARAGDFDNAWYLAMARVDHVFSPENPKELTARECVRIFG